MQFLRARAIGPGLFYFLRMSVFKPENDSGNVL